MRGWPRSCSHHLHTVGLPLPLPPTDVRMRVGEGRTAAHDIAPSGEPNGTTRRNGPPPPSVGSPLPRDRTDGHGATPSSPAPAGKSHGTSPVPTSAGTQAPPLDAASSSACLCRQNAAGEPPAQRRPARMELHDRASVSGRVHAPPILSHFLRHTVRSPLLSILRPEQFGLRLLAADRRREAQRPQGIHAVRHTPIPRKGHLPPLR